MFGLFVDFVRDDQGVPPVFRGIDINLLEKVLKYHGMRLVGVLVALAQASYVNPSNDDRRCIIGDGLKYIVVYADPNPRRNPLPTKVSLKQLVPM